MTPCIRCGEPASNRNKYCSRHWAMLPYDLQQKVWAGMGGDLLEMCRQEIWLREEPLHDE